MQKYLSVLRESTRGTPRRDCVLLQISKHFSSCRKGAELEVVAFRMPRLLPIAIMDSAALQFYISVSVSSPLHARPSQCLSPQASAHHRSH